MIFVYRGKAAASAVFRVTQRVYLRQLQGSHDSSEAEHVAHGALELGGDLDDFVQQGGPLLCCPGAAQHVHGQHGGHGLEPAGGKNLAHVTAEAPNLQQNPQMRCAKRGKQGCPRYFWCCTLYSNKTLAKASRG